MIASAVRAWRFYGFNDIRLDELSDPTCGPDDVIPSVRVVQPSVDTERVPAHSRLETGDR